MRNLEFKARFADLSRAEQIARSLGAEFGGDLHQQDTYFCVPAGRLKLREIHQAGTGQEPRTYSSELIFYQRPELSPTRWSEYYTAPIEQADSLHHVLSRALSVRRQVEKSRKLFLYRDARIHLDRVKHLGEFIEFEVAAQGKEDTAKSLMQTLMRAFGLHDEDAVWASYVDLIEESFKLPRN